MPRNQYKLLSEKYLQEIVKAAKEDEVDSEELAIGIKVEMEHTNDKEKAKHIALQHLAELPDYYSRLKKIEKKKKITEGDDKEDILTGLESLESEQNILQAFINAKSVEEIIDITDRHYEALKDISTKEDNSLATRIYDYNVNLYLAVAWAALLLQRYNYAKWRKYNSLPEDPDLAERIEFNKQEIYDYYRLYLRNREEPEQELQEDDKEDIMAGLEELGDIPQVIYGIDTEMCRGEYDRGETRVWGPDEIYKIYFEDEDAVNYYSDFVSDFRPYTFEAFIDKIKTGGVVTISGEETAESFCINKERLEKEIDDWEKENGYEEELDESDKEDIVAGLEELITGNLPPKESVPYVLQKMEYDGLWPDYAVKLHGVIPSTARKVFDGVYIDTAPAVNKKYKDSPGTDEKGFYTLYITRPDYMELFIKYNDGDYDNPELREMWQHIYSALEMTGLTDPTLPT